MCIVLEHVLLGIRYLIDLAIPDTPLDVRRIDDFNAHFRRTMVKYPALVVPPAERYEQEFAEVSGGGLQDRRGHECVPGGPGGVHCEDSMMQAGGGFPAELGSCVRASGLSQWICSPAGRGPTAQVR